MDFTPEINGTAFSDAFETLLDNSLQKARLDDRPREYLGGSRLGVECFRALAFEWHKTPKDPDRDFSGRLFRIFDRGHDGEERMVEYLRLAGFNLLVEKPNGDQFGFATAGGKIAGHIDGVFADGPPLIGPVEMRYPALWENKELGDKGFRNCQNNGVQKAYPVYYVQMQIYMAYLDLTKYPALFTVKNANTQEVYTELVPFDAKAAQAASDKGLKVVSSSSPFEFPRIASDPGFFKCKFCDWHDRCWNSKEQETVVASAPSWFGGNK